MSPRFGDYRLEFIYRAGSSEQHAEAVAFWLAQGALADRQEAERRAHELVFLVLRVDGVLAGVSTVALQTGTDGRTYYAYRMFLRKEDRVPYLMWAVTDATRDHLRDYDAPPPKPLGMLIVTENRKLMRPGMRRSFQRHNYHYRGKTARGLDVWLAPFDQPSSP
ncbi:MAG: hypothetical protein Q8O33_01375 [Pseudomonadota bacterium]|nr:hypothetical protein [Pseudomonadota bacterium]